MNTTTIKRSYILAAAFAVTLLVQMALAIPAHAASRTWDGEGSDDKFSTAANWVGDVAPVGGDMITLDTTGMTDGTFTNDLAADTAFEALIFNGDGSGSFTLTGNSIELTTGLANLATYNYARFNVELDITSTATNLDVTTNSKIVIGATDGSNTLDLGAFSLSKSGEYPLIINSVLTGTGDITVSGGNFIANEDNTFTGTITIQTGATLKGSGTVGDVAVESGGEVAPGMSPGCLTTGDLTFVSGSIFTVEIDGATECTEYDQTIAVGVVDLGGATLVLDRLTSYEPADGTEFIIIDNDGTADGVTGTFAGLAEGESTTVDGVEYTVSYEGGDGNDVVLSATMVAVPTEPDTGFGPIALNFLFIAMATALATGGMVIAGRKLQDVKAQK